MGAWLWAMGSPAEPVSSSVGFSRAVHPHPWKPGQAETGRTWEADAFIKPSSPQPPPPSCSGAPRGRDSEALGEDAVRPSQWPSSQAWSTAGVGSLLRLRADPGRAPPSPGSAGATFAQDVHSVSWLQGQILAHSLWQGEGWRVSSALGEGPAAP